MTTNILKEVEYIDGNFPKETLLKAIEQRNEIIPELLRILEYTCENAESIVEEEDYIAHIYALYLLAQFREKSAYPIICSLLNKPYEVLDKLLEDMITEGISRILASVFNGEVEPIKNIIENQEIDEYVRAAALDSLVVLVAQGFIMRDELIVYLQSLFHGGLEREYSFIWDALAMSCYHIHPDETFKDIEIAFEDELVDPGFVSLDEIKEQLGKEKQSVLDELHDDPNYQLINDTISELELWACFNEDNDKVSTLTIAENSKDIINLESYQKSYREPYRVENKIGRNDPCPCGSGKKYKKCCGKNI